MKITVNILNGRNLGKAEISHSTMNYKALKSAWTVIKLVLIYNLVVSGSKGK